MVSLVLLLGGTLALTATAAPTPGAAPPAPAPPLPLPTGGNCTPDSAEPVCHLPTATTTPPPGVPLPIPTGPTTPVSCFPGSLQDACRPPATPPTTAAPTAPCTGWGCIPQPSSSPPPPTGPGSGQGGSGKEDCGITHIGGCIDNAINGFFRGVVNDAINPLLDLLSKTLLTTPSPDSLPRIGELWNSSWQILLACYALLIVIAGVVVMSYETLHARHSVKEIAPRIVVGFLAGALSLWVATTAIRLANALAHAVMASGVDAPTAAATLRAIVLNPINSATGGIFTTLLGLALVVAVVAVLIGYIVRVMLTIILIVGAPLAMMFHALPQTEGIAYWWWKAFGGCLAIQIVQSLTLITAIRIFLAPGGFTLFGAPS